MGDFFWFRFARGSGLFFGAGLAFALAALTLAGLRIDLFGGIRPAPFTSFQGFSRLWRRGAHHAPPEGAEKEVVAVVARPCRGDWALLGQPPHQMLSL